MSKIYSYYDPIIIDQSQADSRNLIMPHQKEAVEALSRYFDLSGGTGEQNGLIAMPTGSGKTYTAVNWLLTYGIANDYRVVCLSHRQEFLGTPKGC